MDLQHLPPGVLHAIVLRLPDPGGLAATCCAMAAQLSQDSLHLDWALAWGPFGDMQRRHSGYALLQWRRLHCMGMARLAALLLRLEAKQTAADAAASHMAQSREPFDHSDALGTFQALLPHSEHLLLSYAAQSGHMRLLNELLQHQEPAAVVQLQWGGVCRASKMAVLVAACAAARGDQAAALQALMAALEASGQLSAIQLAGQHLQLLEIAVEAGAADCVLALVPLCTQQLKPCGAAGQVLLTEAARTGIAASITALLGAGVQRSSSAYASALRQGHLHLLPLLKPHDMSQTRAAELACGLANLSSEQQVALLPNLMLQCWDLPGHYWSRLNSLTAMFSANNVEALDAVWAAFTAAKDKAELAVSLISALACMVKLPCDEVQQWVLDHAVPAVHSAAGSTALTKGAAGQALAHGHMELLAALQAASVTEELANLSAEWGWKRHRGQLLHAVRRGDANAVTSAMQELGQHTVGLPLMAEALQRAAALPDAGAVEGVVRALAPHIYDWCEVHMGYNVLLAHDGSILRLLCEEAPAVRAALIGEGCYTALCSRALQAGNIFIAHWLVCHPQQQAQYLDSVLIVPLLGAQQPWLGCELLYGLTELLHRLASPQLAAGDNAAVRETGASEGKSSSKQPPAGARKLSATFLHDVLRSGMPDLLHALLRFMDRWPAASLC